MKLNWNTKQKNKKKKKAMAEIKLSKKERDYIIGLLGYQLISYEENVKLKTVSYEQKQEFKNQIHRISITIKKLRNEKVYR